MMEAIKQWLNGARDYHAGVKLLVKYHQDGKLKRLYLTEAATDYKRKRLAKELAGLLRSAAPPAAPKAETAAPVAAVVKTYGWPGEMDAVVEALHQQWKPLFLELSHLNTRLADVARAGNTEETNKMAQRILNLDDACDAFYHKRDTYLKTGKLPEEKQTPGKFKTDPLQMVVALKNAERYVREAKQDLTKDPADLKAAKRLKKHQDAVAWYKEQLKLE